MVLQFSLKKASTVMLETLWLVHNYVSPLSYVTLSQSTFSDTYCTQLALANSSAGSPSPFLYSLAFDAREAVWVVGLPHGLSQHAIDVATALGTLDSIKFLVVLFAVVGVVLDKVPP